MRKYKTFFICCLISILIWISASLWGYYDYSNAHSKKKIENRQNILVHKYAGNSKELFFLIFKNNIKCCTVNIIGGGILEIPTIYNTFFNGRVLGSQISNILLDNDNKIERIDRIIPHSFEIFGFWLSGGVGFFIVFIVYKLLFISNSIAKADILLILYGIINSVIIIFFAAVIEAYISFNM